MTFASADLWSASEVPLRGWERWKNPEIRYSPASRASLVPRAGQRLDNDWTLEHTTDKPASAPPPTLLFVGSPRHLAFASGGPAGSWP